MCVPHVFGSVSSFTQVDIIVFKTLFNLLVGRGGPVYSGYESHWLSIAL